MSFLDSLKIQYLTSRYNQISYNIYFSKIETKSPPSPRVDGRPLDRDTTINIDGNNVKIDADDLESMCILGRGAYGVVEKVRHIKTGTILAVKVCNYSF